MVTRILIVDDNSDSRSMLAELLKMESYEVMTAENGHTGYDVARAGCPDLILTDLNMPDGDGIKMIRELRKEPYLNRVPIVVVTGYGEWKATLALEAGANAIVQKPIELDLLLQKLKRLLAGAGGDVAS